MIDYIARFLVFIFLCAAIVTVFLIGLMFYVEFIAVL